MPRAFIMSDAHMEAFSRQQTSRFEDEMFHYLRGSHSAVCMNMGESKTRKLINEGIDKAKGYNITLECDVARFIELMVTLAADFDTSEKSPWAKPILTQKHLTGTQKLDQIELAHASNGGGC